MLPSLACQVGPPKWMPADNLLTIEEPIEVVRWDDDKADIIIVPATRMSFETAQSLGYS